MPRLTRKMNDDVTLYEFEQDAYSTKTAVLVGAVKGLFLPGGALSRQEARIQEDTDATLFLDPSNSVIAGLGGQIKGLIVRVEKQHYPTTGDAEDWYEIRRVRVSGDHLLQNRTRFIRCGLQKINKPAVEEES